MYQIELSEAAFADLDQFTPAEVEGLFLILLSWQDTPKPAGVRAIPMPEAADGIAYLYESNVYKIIYHIYETARIVRIMVVAQKISLN